MKTQTVSKQVSRKIRVSKKAAQVAPKSLWFFVATPSSMKLLRAYFIACIHAQFAYAVGKPFKLWGGANVSTHVDSGKLTRNNGVYALTAPGLNYFSDELQKPDADLLARMLAAVRTGKGCKDYANTKGQPMEMIERKLA